MPWSLLDSDGNLVLGSGNVIPDVRDLALVFRRGMLCRQETADSDEVSRMMPCGRGRWACRSGRCCTSSNRETAAARRPAG
ncbi:hypothetical protein AWV80_36395 [Cupriavidus sp. UYMU48A]|nr:hypothetical protein AWV80_36395 [Cupriavidus sp. UYMU48A]